MALSEMLAGQHQQAPQPQSATADPQQALAQLQQLVTTLQSVTDEESYQAMKQQFSDMGGDMSELPENYDPSQIEQMIDLVMQLMEHIASGGRGEGEMNNA